MAGGHQTPLEPTGAESRTRAVTQLKQILNAAGLNLALVELSGS